MQLYLGEGAREYLPMIRHAVRTWNDVLPGKVIELREELVSYPLGPLPYSNEGRNYYGDGASVIYVPDEFRLNGYAIAHYNYRNGERYELVESDMFIRPVRYTREELETAPHLLIDTDRARTIVHEIGHGLGLGHISVSGSIMSYDYWISAVERLEPFSLLNRFPKPYGPGPWQPAWWSHLLFEDPNYRDLAFKSILPGTQDKLALSCLYSEWTGE